MNINEMVDKYMGHTQEVDTGVEMYLKREAYKQGAMDMVKHITDILSNLRGIADRESNVLEDNVTELVDSRSEGDKEREERVIIRQSWLMFKTLQNWYCVEQEIQKIIDLIADDESK